MVERSREVLALVRASPWADLIHEMLHRYGSMDRVVITEDWARPELVIVTYWLVTGETHTVGLPMELLVGREFAEVERRLTERLGALPG